MELTSSFFVDVTEGSRFYENIFVSGGALLADDNFLKTIQLGESMDSLHLHARGGKRKVEGGERVKGETVLGGNERGKRREG